MGRQCGVWRGGMLFDHDDDDEGDGLMNWGMQIAQNKILYWKIIYKSLIMSLVLSDW